MNEIIERLAREAGVTQQMFDPDGMPLWVALPQELEAFAKAVARECAKIADARIYGDHAAHAIREKFRR